MDPIALVEQHSAHNYHPLPVLLARGSGAWVEDVQGRRYLDCLSAYSAVNQGHCHPAIIGALVEQASRITLTSRAFHNEHLGPLCAELAALSGFSRVLPMNSGAEAVETGLKAARKWGVEVKGIPEGEVEIIACEGNFHGRTTTIVSFSTEAQYRQGFAPFTPGFRLVPFGDAEALEAAITPRTAAVLLEPIQAEAGILVPPAGYLRRLREICDRHRVLLFLDEIQTGLGRTGRLFDFEHEGLRPDCLALGKALGGGVLPISAFLAQDEVMSVFRPGDHGSTFGGNPLASAVARAALRVIVDEGLPARAAELGEWMLAELRALPSPHVREVRGRGLLIGVEIRVESGPARPFCERLMERGMLCKETHGQVIRLAPPLVSTREDLRFGLHQLREVLCS
jgi:ornithine--oxo-acid transaminase